MQKEQPNSNKDKTPKKLSKEKEALKLKFIEYLKQYKEEIYKIAYYYAKNKDDAEDLAQEACTKAYCYFHTFKEGSSFKAWMFKIINNTFKGIWTKKQKHGTSEYIKGIKEDLYKFQDKDRLEDQLISIDINLLKKKITTLPKEFKEVITLYDIQGLSYEEIAQKININIGTVRSRLHRARAILKEQIGNDI